MVVGDTWIQKHREMRLQMSKLSSREGRGQLINRCQYCKLAAGQIQDARPRFNGGLWDDSRTVLKEWLQERES